MCFGHIPCEYFNLDPYNNIYYIYLLLYSHSVLKYFTFLPIYIYVYNRKLG